MKTTPLPCRASFFLWTLAFFLAFAPVFGQGLKLASDVYPPFTDVPGEKSVALDWVERVLQRVGTEADFEIVAFDEVMEGIAKGTYQGSAALWKSDEREERLIMSEPYMENRLVLVGRKGASVNLMEPAQLQGKRVGVVGEYAYGLPAEAGMSLVRNESDQRNLSQLLSGQLDYILVDALVIAYMLEYLTNDVSALLEIGDTPFMVKGLHLAIAKEVPGAAQMIASFNAHHRALLAEGAMNEVLGLGAIRADVTGDGRMELVLSGDHLGREHPQMAYALLFGGGESKAETGSIYHEGKAYGSWKDVPDRLKAPIETPQNPADAGIKIKLR